MNIYEIVKKLTGNIEPVGETNVDAKRLENLKTQCQLVEKLLDDIRVVTKYQNCQEYSMKKAGEYAAKFILTEKEWM